MCLSPYILLLASQHIHLKGIWGLKGERMRSLYVVEARRILLFGAMHTFRINWCTKHIRTGIYPLSENVSSKGVGGGAGNIRERSKEKVTHELSFSSSSSCYMLTTRLLDAAYDVYHHNKHPPFSFVHVFRIIIMDFWIQIILFPCLLPYFYRCSLTQDDLLLSSWIT